MCIDAEWDPVGRYVATFVVQPIHRGGDYRAIVSSFFFKVIAAHIQMYTYTHTHEKIPVN